MYSILQKKVRSKKYNSNILQAFDNKEKTLLWVASNIICIAIYFKTGNDILFISIAIFLGRFIWFDTWKDIFNQIKKELHELTPIFIIIVFYVVLFSVIVIIFNKQAIEVAIGSSIGLCISVIFGIMNVIIKEKTKENEKLKLENQNLKNDDNIK
jgi:hypothetical protein